MTEDTPSLQRPTSRAARLSAVEEALLTNIVTSQSQLSDILASENIEVTQATLSRDLDELGAVKTRLEDGTIAYTMSGRHVNTGAATPVQVPQAASCGSAGTSGVSAKAEQHMTRILSGLVTSVAAARNLIVLHTPSGAAQYVGSVIDRQPVDGVLGTIAGDDTVMIVCTDDNVANERSQWLLAIASGATGISTS